MSTYTNNNYAPPPPLGQMNLINGMHSPVQQQQQPEPQQQSQQIQQQQQQVLLQKQQLQQQQMQCQQQQQQLLQQKQQLQQLQEQRQPISTMLPPTTTATAAAANSNINKYLPPTATATATATSNFNVSAAQQNGPMRMPPTTPMAAAAATNHLPAHLRPPGLNGPTTEATLHNGSGNGISANSSRTASPALLQAMSPPPTTTATATAVINQQQHNMPTSNAAAAAAGLTGSMQNLNLNKNNILPPAMNAAATSSNQQLQQSQQLRQQQQTNFRTSALNSAVPTSMPPVVNASPMPSVHRPMAAQQLPPTNIPYGQQQTQASPLLPRTTTPQMPPTSAANMPPQPANTALQQNVLNNNQQMPPPPLQRRPMYPAMPPTNSQQQQTLMQPQQQQQQQQQQHPYAQAYHQQPPLTAAVSSQPTGVFNGQPNIGPLQYQSQKYAPSVQQQQQQPQQPQPQTYPFPSGPSQYNPQMSVANQGFSSLWGQDTIDLMQNRHILTAATLQPPKIVLHNQFQESINCSPNIMRCTIAKIPETNALLQKSRLPLGILIHPFRDINSLPVIQCPSIVRCRLCRTYINPFVYFVDSKLWKCNLCYRVNELPEDFQFDPATKTYGDVTRRPEVRSSTIEFIAPSEYMLRPPQPAIYLFLFDVSIIAQQSGYLEAVCSTLSKHLDDMPGDARAQVGFIAYNSHVHFYSLAEDYNQPHEMTMIDIDEPFLPRPDNLLVNLKECKELVKDLLTQLPKRFAETHDPGSAMGSALQVAYKLMQSTGGRVTVFQTCLPNKGPGALESREDPNNRSGKDVMHLNPATDFYKRYALECSGYQIAVDLFLLNQQYSDLATISGISKHSGGCVHHFPLYQKNRPQNVDSLKQCLTRYLTRKIGFEAVMRIRCTRGLQVHTFHGNFFVRSTDLLSLPNVNPDAGYGMQISYEESLTDVKTICFQAALLYTNSEGERRIRVHTVCLPVTSSLPELMHAADAEAIVGLLSKMAVDRSLTSNMTDAREAFINATVDIYNAFKIAQNLPSGQSGQLITPRSLALLPLYILALLKHPAFRVGTSTRLDDRVYAMDSMKTLPLDQLMKFIYPEFYQIDALFYYVQQNANSNATDEDDEEDELPELQRLQLSAEYLDSRSVFLLDCGNTILIYVGLNVPVDILEKAFGIKSTAELPDYYYGLPGINSAENDILKRFLMRLNDEKPYQPLVQIIRDTSTAKPQFIERLVDDRSESSLSYYEFLQHIRAQVK